MANKSKTKETAKTIERILWDSANELRGNLDAAEYRLFAQSVALEAEIRKQLVTISINF